MNRKYEPSADTTKAIEIAKLWGQVPIETLREALRELEPQFKREHELAIARIEQQAALETARFQAADHAEARRHVLNLTGLICGFTLSGGMVVGAVMVGLHGQLGLAALLLGPSLLALAALFVTRKSDPQLVRAVAAQRASTGSADHAPKAISPAP